MQTTSGWNPFLKGAVSCLRASQVFIPDRHIPSWFRPCSQAINQDNTATLAAHYCTRGIREAAARGTQWHKGMERGQFCWSANSVPSRKVIWESDCFLEIAFHFPVMELWEVAKSCFNFHRHSPSLPADPGGNHRLFDAGNRLQFDPVWW